MAEEELNDFEHALQNALGTKKDIITPQELSTGVLRLFSLEAEENWEGSWQDEIAEAVSSTINEKGEFFLRRYLKNRSPFAFYYFCKDNSQRFSAFK